MDSDAKERGENLLPFVFLSCNGRANMCDYSDFYHRDGLKPELFECPICGSNSCTVKYLERFKSVDELKEEWKEREEKRKEEWEAYAKTEEFRKKIEESKRKSEIRALRFLLKKNDSLLFKHNIEYDDYTETRKFYLEELEKTKLPTE